MDIQLSNSSDNSLKIGDVFTPLEWGAFAIDKFKIFDDWLAGCSIFDPTMGPGNLLEALVLHGKKLGYSIDQLPTERLFGNELNTEYYDQAIKKFSIKFNFDMSDNFWNEDILSLPPKKFDILLGNPPWQNFVDLPETYKAKIKSEFFKYDLIGNSQKLLLGGSRIDIAALIVQKTIKDFLKKSGNAYFFMPLSLLLNDGANQQFRTYKINSTYYAPLKVYDFNEAKVFEAVVTRYGLVHFKRDVKASFPITYERYENNSWRTFCAKPLLHETNPLSIIESDAIDILENFEPICINKESTPRQGINTCGANSILFFKSYEKIDDSRCLVDNKVVLPSKYVYPLLTAKNFRESNYPAQKWVLLPYATTGKPLEENQIKSEPELWEYLLTHQEHLASRKGSLIGAWFKRGYWWALLGVGPYNFMPYKVVWEAYGKKEFHPIIFEGMWQANQSLQAFIPTRTIEEARQILQKLKNPAVEAYLLSLKMEGTMNWAQPGKIKKLIKYKEDSLTLFD